MKRLLLITLSCSYLMASNMMSGWNNNENKEALKVQKQEEVHMCKLYTQKIKKYKETMRNDELAQATLNNYIRLQKKYCK